MNISLSIFEKKLYDFDSDCSPRGFIASGNQSLLFFQQIFQMTARIVYMITKWVILKTQFRSFENRCVFFIKSMKLKFFHTNYIKLRKMSNIPAQKVLYILGIIQVLSNNVRTFSG